MGQYAWLEYEDGMWNLLTTLFEDPCDATRRWSDRRLAFADLKKEGWTIMRPYRRMLAVEQNFEKGPSGYGLIRRPGNWPN